MSLNRYAARRDANEPAIVEALEKIGCSVFLMKEPCDLACGVRGLTLFLEVKNPDKPRLDRQLTAAQAKFHAEWRGHIQTVETPQEAVEAVQRALRSQQ